MINKLTKIYTICLFSCSVLLGQNINLNGQITDSDNGEPLIGANVIIEGNGLNTGAATDAQGNYLIEGVSPGSYEIKISNEGFMYAC